MDLVDEGLELHPVLAARAAFDERAEPLEIAARHEVLAAAQHQAAHGGIVLRGEHAFSQRKRESLIERVQRLRPVQGERGHAAFARDQDRRLRHARRIPSAGRRAACVRTPALPGCP
jgi:hypothetical protein